MKALPLLTLSGGLLLEAGSVAGFLGVPGLLSWPVALVLHGFASALFAHGLSALPDPLAAQRRNWAVLGGLLAFLLPLYGMGMLLGIRGILPWMRRRRSVYAEYEEYIAYATRVEEPLEPLEDPERALLAQVDVEPFVDLMSSEDTEAKVRALQYLSRIRTAEAVQLMKKALADPHPEVRYHGATGLSRLEALYLQDIQRARAEAERHRASARHRFTLAQAHLDYARSGLPDPLTARSHLEEAVRALESCLRMDPHQPAALTQLGLCRKMLGDRAAAREVLQQALAQDSGHVPALAAMAELAFLEGDLKEVRAWSRP